MMKELQRGSNKPITSGQWPLPFTVRWLSMVVCTESEVVRMHTEKVIITNNNRFISNENIII